MPRKPGSDSSDTALFGMLRNKLFGGSKSKPASRPARGATADVKQPTPKASAPTRSAAPPKPAPKAAASTSSMPAPRRMTAAERKANATRKEPVAPKRTPKVTVQEAPPARPAYTDVSAPPRMPRNFGTPDKKKSDYPTYEKNSDEAKSFRSAFAAARKDGAKTFMWEGRKYTTDVKK